MDIEAVRTFVTVVDTGQFQEAAVDLRISQQAVSKRVAGLERALGVTLFVRTARGARPTLDGQAFLPHAREVLRAVERAAASVRPGDRMLRVDVLHRRIAPALAVRGFYQGHPGTDLDVVTLADANVAGAAEAVRAGEVDATFRAVPAGALPEGIGAERVLDDPLQLLVGPRHPLASARSLAPADLAGHRIWIPGIKRGTEWAAYYDELAEDFGLRIDAVGPDFGTEALMDSIADSAALATLVGSRDRYVWPTAHDLRRIPVVGPTPVYPHTFLYRTDNPHPVLAALRGYLVRVRPDPPSDVWTPVWARAR
ncbi:LysR family transcriptional regulator [Streptomyces griseus]|uniref:LysR family transcriptional regulator n=1 Tax=Streptomyces TaxID=1883 RepID=UPI0029C4C7EB|nr:LysR family transcriptional regulator [Streptomyces sp. ID01-9D]MDX5571854.1 LysR family transcriptional regulator [Streptomyces sp. ID01-9D]WTC91966.1 LysR family transcriptional regulator [Streptomyces griseus]WTD65402.1 LysR family transcriptional regulator [Streptomyces griseus]